MVSCSKWPRRDIQDVEMPEITCGLSRKKDLLALLISSRAEHNLVRNDRFKDSLLQPKALNNVCRVHNICASWRSCCGWTLHLPAGGSALSSARAGAVFFRLPTNCSFLLINWYSDILLVQEFQVKNDISEQSGHCCYTPNDLKARKSDILGDCNGIIIQWQRAYQGQKAAALPPGPELLCHP